MQRGCARKRGVRMHERGQKSHSVCKKRVRSIECFRCGYESHCVNRITDINKHCISEFRKHWECLENNNHQLYNCRKPEWNLNKCVYENLVRLHTRLSISL